FVSCSPRTPSAPLFPYPTLFRSRADLRQRLDFGQRTGQGQFVLRADRAGDDGVGHRIERVVADEAQHVRDLGVVGTDVALDEGLDRKSTRLNSSHVKISYAVFCL